MINNGAIYYAMLDGRTSVSVAAVVCHRRRGGRLAQRGLLWDRRHFKESSLD